MDLRNWEIKILEWQLLDYQKWGEDAVARGSYETVLEALRGNNTNIGKIKKSLEKMLKAYSHLNFAGLADEEKVSLITTQQNYKKRIERDEEEKLKDLQISKNMANKALDTIIEEMAIYFDKIISLTFNEELKQTKITEKETKITTRINEKASKITEINNCSTVQEVAQKNVINYQELDNLKIELQQLKEV